MVHKVPVLAKDSGQDRGGQGCIECGKECWRVAGLVLGCPSTGSRVGRCVD